MEKTLASIDAELGPQLDRMGERLSALIQDLPIGPVPRPTFIEFVAYTERCLKERLSKRGHCCCCPWRPDGL